MIDPALEELAALHGVATEYVDDRGAHHQVAPESLLAVLAALGVPVARAGACRDAVRAERLRRHRETVAPVVAGRHGHALTVRVRLEGTVASGRDVDVVVHGEDGSGHRVPAERIVAAGSSTLEGVTVHAYDVALDPPGAAGLTPGYHGVEVEAGGRRTSALAVVAPRCPRPDRGWGIFVSLPALRTAANWGIGTYAELAEVSSWAAELGAAFVGTLPLFPTRPERADPSPYLPLTRLAWHEPFLDAASLPAGPPWPGTGTIPDGAGQTMVEELRRSDRVRWAPVAALVRRAVARAADSAFAPSSPLRPALEAFAGDRPELVAYARFRSADEQGRRLPPRRDGDAPEPLDALDAAAREHLFAQWACELQLARAGGRLYLDLPIGVDPSGFDPWWTPGAFAPGVEGGAPPDAFFADGQTWGFHPLHPERMRTDRHRHLIQCLRHVMRHASVVRIDHVMGLRRLFWVPEGAGPADGTYVRYPMGELFAVLAVEAERSGTAVVGEDLGTVPPSVRAAMTDHGLLRSWVLEFEVAGDDPLPVPPEECLATVETHDLPRFAAFWDEDDLDEAAAGGQRPPAEIEADRIRRRAWRRAVAGTGSATDGLRACLTHLGRGPARLAMVDLEDLWLERRRINRPGTGPEAGNWTARMRPTFDEIRDDRTVLGLLAGLDRRAGGDRGDDRDSQAPPVDREPS